MAKWHFYCETALNQLKLMVVYEMQRQLTLSPHQPRRPAGIFYRPDTYNKISAIWIRTHTASEQLGKVLRET